MLRRDELKQFLDRKVEEYNNPSFIAGDPVSVPHRFSGKQDIEIAGLFAAIFAWGNRTTIINKAVELMQLMGESPHDFIVNHREKQLRRFEPFCHRTFNATDLLYFIAFLRRHYRAHNSLEEAFFPPAFFTGTVKEAPPDMRERLNYFHHYFFSLPDYPPRTKKHIAAPFKNSACKRINMFLRWMVRDDGKGVDFGLWNRFRPSELICPLDLHVARVAKRFGLLDRPAADWLAAEALTARLRELDAADPVKYDFALFTLGAVERF